MIELTISLSFLDDVKLNGAFSPNLYTPLFLYMNNPSVLFEQSGVDYYKHPLLRMHALRSPN